MKIVGCCFWMSVAACSGATSSPDHPPASGAEGDPAGQTTSSPSSPSSPGASGTGESAIPLRPAAAEFSTLRNTPLRGKLMAANDTSEPLRFLADTSPTKGSLTIDNPTTGEFTYTPQADFAGRDSFTFMVAAGSVLSRSAQVKVKVNTAENNELRLQPVNGSSVTAGSCNGFEITRLGDVDLLGQALVVSLGGPLEFFSGTNCDGPAATTVTLSPGQDALIVPTRGTTAGDVVASATAPPYAATSVPITILPGRITTLGLSGPTTIPLGTCAKYTVRGRDAYNNLSTQATDLELHAPPVYRDAGCSQSIPNARVVGGPPVTGLDFYIRPSATGSFSFSVLASNRSIRSNEIRYRVE